MSMLQVEQLVQRRQALFGYLKRVLSGNVFFLNTVKVRPAEIEAHFEQSSDARDFKFMTLGLSIGRLLEQPAGAQSVAGFAQLMEEFEYRFAGATVQSMKYLRGKSRPSTSPAESNTVSPTSAVNMSPSPAASVGPEIPSLDNETIGAVQKQRATDGFGRPSLFFYGKTVIYDFLVTPSSNMPLSYLSVIEACCDTLVALYAKLNDPTVVRPSVFEQLIQVDSLLKEHFIDPIVDVLVKTADDAQTRELRGLATAFYSRDGSFQSMVAALGDETTASAQTDQE